MGLLTLAFTIVAMGVRVDAAPHGGAAFACNPALPAIRSSAIMSLQGPPRLRVGFTSVAPITFSPALRVTARRPGSFEPLKSAEATNVESEGEEDIAAALAEQRAKDEKLWAAVQPQHTLPARFPQHLKSCAGRGCSACLCGSPPRDFAQTRRWAHHPRHEIWGSSI
jgi:hypothetical protein